MKRTFSILALILAFNYCLFSQGRNISITPEYKPMTQQELELYARAEAVRQAYNKQQFEEYSAKAYERLQVLDYTGFIYYSDYALKFGWYNNKMYYDRGQAYERLHEYRKAKKEYKKAIKTGYYPATQALDLCKENERRWRKNKW